MIAYGLLGACYGFYRGHTNQEEEYFQLSVNKEPVNTKVIVSTLERAGTGAILGTYPVLTLTSIVCLLVEHKYRHYMTKNDK